MLRSLGTVVLLCLFCVHVQGRPFACCNGGGEMVYGFCDSALPGIKDWDDFKICWERAKVHFSNTTVVGEYNLTLAERYSIFTLVLDKNVTEISALQEQGPLTFSADIIPEGSIPEYGYLPWEISVSLPFSADVCPKFIFSNLAVNLTLQGEQRRPPNAINLKFSITGCGRQTQRISNFTFKGLGYSGLELAHLTLTDSNILAIEHVSVDNTSGLDAMSFIESDVRNSSLSYFGDVTGMLGTTYGLSQYGSRAVASTFVVVDPDDFVENFRWRSPNDFNPYQFSWYGGYPQEVDNFSTGFVHIDRTTVEYIRDLQLGSVNVSACTFAPWISKKNPAFSREHARTISKDPPGILIYNMEMSLKSSNTLTKATRIAEARKAWLKVAARAIELAGSCSTTSSASCLHAKDFLQPASAEDRLLFGSNISLSALYYLWDVAIFRSAITSSTLHWTSHESDMDVPASWAGKDPNPSFLINLESDSPTAAFSQIIRSALLCLRPAFEINRTLAPAQKLTVGNGSVLLDTRVLYVYHDAECDSNLLLMADKSATETLAVNNRSHRVNLI